MHIQIDTREKERAIQKILQEFDRQKVLYFSSKLPIGDYMNLDNARLVVDRKQSLGELCTNLCSPDKSRFWNEIRLAKNLGIKIIFLCEHSKDIKRIQDVATWSSPYTQVRGRDLMEKIYSCHIAYGVDFLFCSKPETGKRIIELLS